jgi:hypothetical protein
MEMIKAELGAVSEVVETVDAELVQLNELQLALVGGGHGDVIFG